MVGRVVLFSVVVVRCCSCSMLWLFRVVLFNAVADPCYSYFVFWLQAIQIIYIMKSFRVI